MTNVKDIYSTLDEYTEIISKYIDDGLSDSIDIKLIKETHGRKKNAPLCCKNGTFIYYLYDKLGNIIYIGETDASVKSRLFGDGSGSHKHKVWFNQVHSVKYYEDYRMDCNRRKSIERALIQKHNPKYNDGK